MMNHGFSRFSVLAAASVALLGCSGGAQDDLSGWMAEQRATARPTVVAVVAPKAYLPQAYQGADAIAPFSEEKLTVLLRAETASPLGSALLAAEMKRRKEPLELVPLDAIAMVGILNRGADMVAVVRSDNLLYQVRTGNHMGQNYGRVTAIAATQITLREIVQDAAGAWIERTSTLQMQEADAR